MKKILVVGGAGYIGSHMTKALALSGYHPIALDDLSTGFVHAVLHGELVVGSMGNGQVLEAVFRKHKIAAVMHFAAFSQVGESMRNPAAYYDNNVGQTLKLLNYMIVHGVKHFIFSSSAAVYGQPVTPLIDESHPKQAINPYGRNKWMIEQILNDYASAYGLNSITLRYFNAAGADPTGELGENHNPETHLIPLVLQAGLGQRGPVTIFGSDYDTPDGTCIRDYIHVEDLCRAHLLALEKLLDGGESDCYNLGNGNEELMAIAINDVGVIKYLKKPVDKAQVKETLLSALAYHREAVETARLKESYRIAIKEMHGIPHIARRARKAVRILLHNSSDLTAFAGATIAVMTGLFFILGITALVLLYLLKMLLGIDLFSAEHLSDILLTR